MPKSGEYVLDSYALLAFFEDEPGSEQVNKLLEVAHQGRYHLYICLINLGEIVYIIAREKGLNAAHATLARIDELPIEQVNVDRALMLAASRLKMDYPIAYADCFAAGLSQIKKAVLVTGDPEFGQIRAESKVHIEWLIK